MKKYVNNQIGDEFLAESLQILRWSEIKHFICVILNKSQAGNITLKSLRKVN